MNHADRCSAAFLGLALGDAYGRPLEFLSGEAVRTRKVDTGHLRWTDDTHMSLYLADAVLDQSGAFNEEAFGDSVGRAFGAWALDPLTPSTAPGNTCLAGVANWRRTGDWRTSGVRGSDGCGAVMRIAPLPMVFTSDALVRAAHIQATITHDSDNARVAAEAGCRILAALLEGVPLDGELVARVARVLPSGSVVRALDAALELSRSRTEWLDDDAIPDGDGGWRSPSALGIAVAAALRWGGDFATTIDRAARIDGDSDSVACLAGMFLGAWGVPLPQEWLAGLYERDRIERTARLLAARAQLPG